MSRAEAVALTVRKISQTLWQLPTKAFHVAVVVDVLADAAETHAKVLRAFFPGLRRLLLGSDHDDKEPKCLRVKMLEPGRCA